MATPDGIRPRSEATITEPSLDRVRARLAVWKGDQARLHGSMEGIHQTRLTSRRGGDIRFHVIEQVVWKADGCIVFASPA
jgi:hypothetical protein